jgi:hypothetical protein
MILKMEDNYAYVKVVLLNYASCLEDMDWR